jgi:hypothetical protein
MYVEMLWQHLQFEPFTGREDQRRASEADAQAVTGRPLSEQAVVAVVEIELRKLADQPR